VGHNTPRAGVFFCTHARFRREKKVSPGSPPVFFSRERRAPPLEGWTPESKVLRRPIPRGGVGGLSLREGYHTARNCRSPLFPPRVFFKSPPFSKRVCAPSPVFRAPRAPKGPFGGLYCGPRPTTLFPPRKKVCKRTVCSASFVGG